MPTPHLQPPPGRTPRQRGLCGALGLASLLLLVACEQQPLLAHHHRGAVTAQPEVRQLTLLTYNVLSDPARASARLPALMALLKDADADVIALQEVAPWFVKALQAQPWYLLYHRTPIRRAEVAPGGLLILSRFPMERILLARLPGPEERLALLADLRINGRTFAVVTTRLETTPAAGKTRVAQLDRIFPLMQHAPSGVLLGDLGFADDAKPETQHLDKAYKDLWTSLRSNAPGYTRDIERNGLARRTALADEESRRLDRILWRSSVWRPHTVRIVGTRPIGAAQPVLFPSDHFGLLGVLQR